MSYLFINLESSTVSIASLISQHHNHDDFDDINIYSHNFNLIRHNKIHLNENIKSDITKPLRRKTPQ